VKETSKPAPKALVDAIAEYYHGEWGFTGTRAGMRAFQVSMVRRVLMHGQPIVWRHGGAFGADFEAHALWREICKEGSIANIWPADEKRASLYRGQPRVKVESVMPALDRTIEIVKRSKFLVAAPHSEQEEPSATWDAIHEGMKINLPILIIWPRSNRMTFYLEKFLHRVTFDSH
jgi:hypothetical protein